MVVVPGARPLSPCSRPRLLPTPLAHRSTMATTIEAQGLTKHYGEVHALDGLDLVAESGRVTALLGPNGAGKTTFINAVATLLRPTSGTLRVAGIDVAADPRAVRRVIGLAGQSASVEPAMTGRENLEMVARLFGLGRSGAREETTAVLDRLGLADAGDRWRRWIRNRRRRGRRRGSRAGARPRRPRRRRWSPRPARAAPPTPSGRPSPRRGPRPSSRAHPRCDTRTRPGSAATCRHCDRFARGHRTRWPGSAACIEAPWCRERTRPPRARRPGGRSCRSAVVASAGTAP